jgi:hypothetical protein
MAVSCGPGRENRIRLIGPLQNFITIEARDRREWR